MRYLLGAGAFALCYAYCSQAARAQPAARPSGDAGLAAAASPSGSPPATTPLPANESPSPAASPPAQASPRPSPTLSASPGPSPFPSGWQLSTQANVTFVGRGTSGQGQIGPEAFAFSAGSPLSPNTPYDLFSSAPLVPGNSGIAEIVTAATYGFAKLNAGLTAGLGYVTGSITNASYWGENLFPTLNPHLGAQALPYTVAFPTHAGQDDGSGLRLSILGGSLGTNDGNFKLRVGWFDLAQTERFIFAPPPLTSVNPAIAYAPAESIATALAGTDTWKPLAGYLPLQGVDVAGKYGLASIEATTAALPSLPGSSARLNGGSVVLDHGEGTRYSAQVIHVNTSGLSFTTTVPFGTNPVFLESPQGVLPTSTLSGQEQTIAGARATVHVVPQWGLDAVAEIGRAWYDARPVVRPGTSAPGGYYHAGLTKTEGRVSASLDFFRMEPRYATLILPYGVPENQWSVAFAWPGQWLKSNYQLVDNTVLGVNRAGYRLRYYVDKGPLEVHLEYTNLRQLEPETIDTSTQTGFIDGYYLPQQNFAATFGRQQRYALWAAWHPSFGDLSIDYVDDLLYRPFLASQPLDRVSYEVPQYVLTYSRHISPVIVAATGIGRYGLTGAFAQPIDFAQRLFFAGVQIQQTPKSAVLATFRRGTFAGITTYPASSLSPNFASSAFILEQRVQL